MLTAVQFGSVLLILSVSHVVGQSRQSRHLQTRLYGNALVLGRTSGSLVSRDPDAVFVASARPECSATRMDFYLSLMYDFSVAWQVCPWSYGDGVWSFNCEYWNKQNEWETRECGNQSYTSNRNEESFDVKVMLVVKFHAPQGTDLDRVFAYCIHNGTDVDKDRCWKVIDWTCFPN